MTTIEKPPPVSPRLLVLAGDDFGAEVARRPLGTSSTTVIDVAAGTHASLWPYADLIVVAGSREQHHVSEAVDAVAFIRGIPWLGLFVRGTDLQVGPVVVPGRTACYRCFVKRRDQHSRPDAAALTPRGPVRAPSGYTRHHVGVAAGMVRAAVREALNPHEITGLGATVWVANQLTTSLSRISVVAVDDCSRCSARFESRRERRTQLWEAIDDVAWPRTAELPVAVAEAGV